MSFGANSSFPYGRSGEAGHQRSVRNGMRTESDGGTASRIDGGSRPASGAADTDAAMMQHSDTQAAQAARRSETKPFLTNSAAFRQIPDLAAIVATSVTATPARGAGIVRRAADISTAAFRLGVESTGIIDRPSAGARGPLNQGRCRRSELLHQESHVRVGGSVALYFLGRGRSDCQTDRKRQERENTTNEHRNSPPIENPFVPHSTCGRKARDSHRPFP